MPLEQPQNITTSIQYYLQQYLEPANPSVPRTYSLLGTFLIFVRNIQFINKTEPFCSLPFINLVIQICNPSYPYTPLKISSNNAMNVDAGYALFDAINQIIPNTGNHLCKIVCSLGLPLIIQYNNPDLFATYTYLYLSAITYEYSPLILYPCAYIACSYYPNSSPIKEILSIFQAKQTMFLIAMLLACLNIKLKNNNILTNPAYWLSIGIAHLLFNNYRLPDEKLKPVPAAIKFFSTACSLFGTNFTFNPENYKHNALRYICDNVIPITAVLISAALPV
jgi:hypothetical protein